MQLVSISKCFVVSARQQITILLTARWVERLLLATRASWPPAASGTLAPRSSLADRSLGRLAPIPSCQDSPGSVSSFASLIRGRRPLLIHYSTVAIFHPARSVRHCEVERCYRYRPSAAQGFVGWPSYLPRWTGNERTTDSC
jgi:hypothetical protein